MSLRSFESSLASEARVVFNNRKLRVKDLMEWRMTEVKPHDDEVVAYLPLNGVWVAIKKELDKRVARSTEETK